MTTQNKNWSRDSAQLRTLTEAPRLQRACPRTLFFPQVWEAKQVQQPLSREIKRGPGSGQRKWSCGEDTSLEQPVSLKAPHPHVTPHFPTSYKIGIIRFLLTFSSVSKNPSYPYLPETKTWTLPMFEQNKTFEPLALRLPHLSLTWLHLLSHDSNDSSKTSFPVPQWGPSMS